MAENDREKNESSDSGVDPCLTSNGGLSYLEIPAIDPRRSATFYEKIVGWNVQEPDTADPRFNDATGHLIGRWVTGRAIAQAPGLLPYIYVDHIHEAVALVPTFGGEVVKGTYREGKLLVATIRDPAGKVIGLWQQGHCSV
jgi:predicted enzyme related to lactoylglutathione lyase